MHLQPTYSSFPSSNSQHSIHSNLENKCQAFKFNLFPDEDLIPLNTNNTPSFIAFLPHVFYQTCSVFKNYIKMTLLFLCSIKKIHHLIGFITLSFCSKSFWSKQVLLPKMIKDLNNQGIQIERFFTETALNQKISGVILGKKKDQDQKRWTLVAFGRGSTYANTLNNENSRSSLITFLEKSRSNIVLFDYPGCGSTPGLLNQESMINAYEVLLTKLEQKAAIILEWGYSMGGAVQALAWKQRTEKKGIYYCSIKTRTFNSFGKAAAHALFHPCCSLIHFSVWLTQVSGWEFHIKPHLKKIKHPEIIIQTVDPDEKITYDGCLYPETSLAQSLGKEVFTWPNKYFIPTSGRHAEGGTFGTNQTCETVANMIEKILSAYYLSYKSSKSSTKNSTFSFAYKNQVVHWLRNKCMIPYFYALQRIYFNSFLPRSDRACCSRHKGAC